jgi:hypothetical protein
MENKEKIKERIDILLKQWPVIKNSIYGLSSDKNIKPRKYFPGLNKSL